MSSKLPPRDGSAGEPRKNAVALAVDVAGLAKCYQIYDKPGDRLRQFIVPRVLRALGLEAREYFREFWALHDVSFQIGQGEVVGIVGRNGSGKSTLLQIVCGTLSPTSGDVLVRGRVAALLELGSGFNPEFTGRDNVYLNAAVIGLTRAEVEARFADIVEFADIGNFIDQPVKTYSSGMAVRLAFAVAINTDPDILIVDEALAVGDELFQRKCFSKIEALRARGVTILFVSHAGGTVIELCDRAILLDAGQLLMDGPPRTVVSMYHKLLYAPAAKSAEIREGILAAGKAADGRSVPAGEGAGVGKVHVSNIVEEETFDPEFVSANLLEFESHGAHILLPTVHAMDGRQVNGLIRGREYLYRYRVRFDQAFTGVRFGMLIKSISGVHLGGALSVASIQDGMTVSAGEWASVDFRFRCHLNPGVYFMNAGVFGCRDETETLLHRLADAVVFRVLPVADGRAQEMVDFGCRAQVEINV
ncbi:MAG: ABC transporter ATP-binding protein [Proteobacteria bacterium]|nr:ABC transporter ATP-binding protein [Pseudomonadota bacterium]